MADREARHSTLQIQGIDLELIWVPDATFVMGSANMDFGEGPAHEVTVLRPFYLGKYPVTQRQWARVMGQNPSVFQQSDSQPVDSVNWHDAVRFCESLAESAGRVVRLPSESEWEYACRAGSSSEFLFANGKFADDSSVPIIVRRELTLYAWFDENSRETTHPVGLKRANDWGLHDMIGNVWEWCADHWHGDYAGAPSDTRPWIDASPRRPLRCLRGGAWDMNAFRCRSCYRSWDWESLATNRSGLRVCVDI